MIDFWQQLNNEYKDGLTEHEVLILILIINDFFK